MVYYKRGVRTGYRHNKRTSSFKYRKHRVSPGFRHIWRYRGVWNERKTGPRTWKFRFKATKGKRSKTFGSFKRGFKVKWHLSGYQTAIKTGKGTYQTDFKGTKRLISSQSR